MVDLLFDWFELGCFANKNKNCQLSYSQFQTSQTGGQQYSDTSPFIIPWLERLFLPSLSSLVQYLRVRARAYYRGQCLKAGNTKGGSIIVPLTSCLTGLDWSVLQIKTKIVSCNTANSKPVKQEVNSIVIPSPLVFPDQSI